MKPAPKKDEPEIAGWRLTDPDPLLFACELCREPAHFFAKLLGGRLACADCWHAIGSPYPHAAATAAQVYAQEQATRERMKRAGGTAKHLVAAGKS